MSNDKEVSLGSSLPGASGLTYGEDDIRDSAGTGNAAEASGNEGGSGGPQAADQQPGQSGVGEVRQGTGPTERGPADQGSDAMAAQAPAEESQSLQQDGEVLGRDELEMSPQQQQQQQVREGEAVQELTQGQVEQQTLKDAEALARAEAFKRDGNELFGRGSWEEAAAMYNAALDAAPSTAAKEQAIYFANLAACNIKTQQYAVAVQNCTEAVQLDASYQKAYMRRCEAFERLDELDHALSDAKKLLEVAPDSAWAKAKIAALQPLVDERTEKLKSEMMSKLKDLGNTILGKFGLSTDNFKFDKDPNTGSYNIKFQQ